MSQREIKACVITTDGQKSYTVLPGGDSANLRALQGYVGGYIEALISADGEVTFWCNEEGKIHGLPVNQLATAYWWQLDPQMRGVDTLRGDVVLTGGMDGVGSTLGLPDAMTELLDTTELADPGV